MTTQPSGADEGVRSDEVSEFARTQADKTPRSFTAGPWQSQHEFDWEGFCTIIGNIDGDPASPTYTTICDINEAPEEYIANRNLICAAPDLYEALKAVHSLISEAAATGFNWKDGDWAERLFASQRRTHQALAAAASPAKGRE
jgi:hypothetical protein